MGLSIPALALIATVGTAASAGVEAYSAHEQGVATANADRQKATAETLNENQKQINMRQKLLQALAAQNAGTLGAVGTGRGTGFGANALRQINQNQNDLMVSSANESAQVSLLDQAADSANAAGNLGAIGDVLSGGTSIAKMWPRS